MPPPLCHCHASCMQCMHQSLPPSCPQPHVPDTELQPQAFLLKKCAYDEYRRFKLGEGPKAIAEYVNLAVLEKPPSSKPEDVKDAMKAMSDLETVALG